MSRFKVKQGIMKSLNKYKKIKIRVKNKKFKKLSMLQLQNCVEGGLWGNWVIKEVIKLEFNQFNRLILIFDEMLYRLVL